MNKNINFYIRIFLWVISYYTFHDNRARMDPEISRQRNFLVKDWITQTKPDLIIYF